MVYGSGRIPVRFSDQEINALLADTREGPTRAVRHFSHTGELFIRFETPIEIPSYPIHHDSAQDKPSPELSRAVRTVIDAAYGFAPDVFRGLTHIFDPSDITHPVLVRFFRVEQQTYAFLLRVDLEYRPQRAELIERTSNTRTPSFRTRDLFVEMDLVPVQRAERTDGVVVAVVVEQSVSETWIGETGRGYMRSGIWLDRDLSLFFSKLFTPPQMKTYPYQIFTCKYRSVAHTACYLHDSELRRSVPMLHKARKFLIPRMREIEGALRSVAQDGFSESLPQFRAMKELISSDWNAVWRSFAIEVYLDDDDKREFRLNHGLF